MKVKFENDLVRLANTQAPLYIDGADNQDAYIEARYDSDKDIMTLEAVRVYESGISGMPAHSASRNWHCVETPPTISGSSLVSLLLNSTFHNALLGVINSDGAKLDDAKEVAFHVAQTSAELIHVFEGLEFVNYDMTFYDVEGEEVDADNASYALYNNGEIKFGITGATPDDRLQKFSDDVELMSDVDQMIVGLFEALTELRDNLSD